MIQSKNNPPELAHAEVVELITSFAAHESTYLVAFGGADHGENLNGSFWPARVHHRANGSRPGTRGRSASLASASKVGAALDSRTLQTPKYRRARWWRSYSHGNPKGGRVTSENV